MAEEVVVGIDVGKAKLDVALLPSGEGFAVSNDQAGVARLEQRLKPLAPVRVVFEATGKLERLAVSKLAAAGLAVVVVNPGQVRHFAKARGQRAKTDLIDARLIAEFARDIRPEIRPLPDAQTVALAALCRRRSQVLEMLSAETNRLERSEPVIRKSIQQVIRLLEQQLARLDHDLDQSIRNSPVWQPKADLLSTVPGIGRVSCSAVLSLLPELGRVSRQKICALVGAAPYPDDSGERCGKRHIAGGRAAVRRVLYMATLSAVRFNPVLRAYYQRLLRKGVKPKAALIAALRKLLTILNAILKHGTPWRPPCPSPA